ncbi:hypothetical protein AB4Y32_16100 [Paraburkholderia phymatum]|uniref:Uncharacterized protein n=1 Tax=Paraburkholderia phymatum TaxID=148447 RepID=A0ACC6U165_9BURK
MTPIELLRAEGNVSIDERDEVCGYWRDNLIWVELEPMGDWYIRVIAPDGCYIYDGWWAESGIESADDAVAEAFDGACLLEGE